MRNKVPVLLIGFNRPDNLERVFNVVKNYKPEKLFIAIDAPRNDQEQKLCDQSKTLEQKVDWPCEVYTKYPESNLGCRIAVSEAITWFFTHIESGVILEDDCLPSLDFFSFCEQALPKYCDNDKVMQISGTNYQHQALGKCYFSTINDIWGWATWKRAWDKFSLEIEEYDPKKVDHYFQNDAISSWLKSYMYDYTQLNANIWSTAWVWAMIKEGSYSLIPPYNLVENIGFNENSTHVSDTFRIYGQYKAYSNIGQGELPHHVEANFKLDAERFKLIKKTDPRLFLSTKLRRSFRETLLFKFMKVIHTKMFKRI